MAVCYLLFAICYLLFAICYLLSAICYLPSAICHLPSAVRILAIAPTSFFADYGCHVRIRGQLAALRARGHDVLLVTYPSGRDVDDIPTVRAPWPRPGPIQVGSSRLKLALDAVLGPTALTAALRFRPHLLHAYLNEGALKIGRAHV